MGKIVEEYFRQRSDVVEASQTPRTVVFNEAGYLRAMKEVEAGEQHFAQEKRFYCSLPYVIDPRQKAEIVVTHDYKHEVERRMYAPRPRELRAAITFSAKILPGEQPEPKTMIEVVAQSLDATTLCDIIRTWLDADCQKWGDFEKELDAVIVKHGRFEQS